MITAGISSVSTSQLLFRVPSGPGNFSVSVSSGTAYVSPGTGATATTGYELTPGQTLTWATYQASTGTPVAAVSASGTATISFWLSTND